MNDTVSTKHSPTGTAVIGNGKRSASKVRLVSPTEPANAQMRLILGAMQGFRDGDFSVRLPNDWVGTEAQIAAAFNQVIAQKKRISKEVTRLSETVGKEGRLKQRMLLPGATRRMGGGGRVAKYADR